MTKQATTADIFEAVKRQIQKQKRQGNTPISFEVVKPLIIATMQGKTVYQHWMDVDKKIPYSTLRIRKKAALEYLNPENSKRQLSASDEAWLQEAFKRYMPS